VFSSVTDISFAAGSNNISYNSINKKATFSFNFNQYYNESYYYIKFPVNPYGGGDAAMVLSGFWDFVRIRISEHGIFFGRIDGRRFGVVCCRNRRRRSIYIFTRVPTFLTGLRI
jgi:hypothetical protein